MNKQTVQLPGSQGMWDSYISKYQPDSQKVLDNMFTANSKNFVTDQTGMIDKRPGEMVWNQTTFSGPARDSYAAIFTFGAQHYLRVGQGVLSASTGNGIFTDIQSGFAPDANFEFATYQDRVYGDNGVNAPIVYDTITNYGGVSYSFTTGKTRPMGAQPPLTAPIAGTPSAGGAVPVGPHRYEVTFVYYGSEESNGSPASNVETATSGFQTIALTAIPIGGYGVTARNIYRDNDDGVFLLLDTINDNTTTTYTDTLLQGSTPTPIPTDNGVPPTFSKIALWLDSLWITPVGNPNTLLYSNAGSPDIFGGNNFVVCQSDDVITAIEVYNGVLYVWGLHSFGSILGNTPDTFYYNNISNTVGCADNRSIQIRSVVSIPTLWWLSNKGIYYSNGYTVEYGSDLIQDLVNLNLAQVNYTLGQNTQNSQAQYAGDTFTPGIDITDIPGTITTLNPKADYSQTSDWLGGSVVTNIDTANSNFAEVPIDFTPTLASGTLAGQAIISGSNITLPLGGNFTGETHSETSKPNFFTQAVNTTYLKSEIAQLIIPPITGILGTISSIDLNCYFPVSGNIPVTVGIKTDLGGLPSGTILASQTFSLNGGNGADHVLSIPTATLNVSLTGGTHYWLFASLGIASGDQAQLSAVGVTSGSPWTGGNSAVVRQGANTWGTFSPPSGGSFSISGHYTYTITPVVEAGQWTSQVYDCGAISSVPATVTITGTQPAFTAYSIAVLTSASPSMSSPNRQAFTNTSGTISLSLTGLEYYQIVIKVSTNDNLFVPTVSAPVLKFSTTATWVSQPIDATTDNTGWDTLTYVGTTPAGTSIAVAIATSPDNITYSSFGPVGGAATEPWAKIRFILTTDSGNTVSPSLSEITLTWSLTSTIVSSPIDTGTTPAGFSTMQYVTPNMGVGTITMYIRTASSSGGLSSASYVLVPNGTVPLLTPLEWLQWKLVFTATADATPQVTSVTVSWFIGTSTVSARCASLFYNKTYYLSVAMIGSPTNDILIELDQFGKWRIMKDISVGTLLLYFNILYFSDGVNGNIYNGFTGVTDNGTPVIMDVRTKAWHETDDIFLKVPRGLKVTGINTGTLLHAYYSIDRGNTFIEMFNEGGTFGYQTSTTGLEFVTLFVPNADTLEPGRTLMFQIISEDAFPCSIINFEPTMYSRKGRYLSNG